MRGTSGSLPPSTKWFDPPGRSKRAAFSPPVPGSNLPKGAGEWEPQGLITDLHDPLNPESGLLSPTLPQSRASHSNTGLKE